MAEIRRFWIQGIVFLFVFFVVVAAVFFVVVLLLFFCYFFVGLGCKSIVV